MIRVLFLLPSSQIGGAERSLLRLIGPLRDRGVETHVAVLDRGGPLLEEATNSAGGHLALGLRPLYSRWRSLKQYLREASIDLLWMQGHRANLLGRLVGRAAGVRGTITSIHGVHLWRRRGALWLDRLTWSRVDRFLSVTERGAELARVVGIPEERIRVIYNGISLRTNRLVSGDERAAARMALSLPEADYTLLFLGNLRRVKNPLMAVDALALLRQRQVPARLLMVGRDEMDGAVQRHVASLGLDESVRFFGYQQEVRPFMAAADVVVLSSDSEGAPIALLEAMACARLVVATNVGGISEMVEDGRTGWLVPPREAGALAEALSYVWDHRGKWSTWTAEARRRVEREFSIGRRADLLSQEFAALMEEHED